MTGKTYAEKPERKQTKAKNMLYRDMSICCSDVPTRYIMVANAGLVTEAHGETLLQLCLPYGEVDGIVMLPGKSYSFVIFKEALSALQAFDAIHGRKKLTPGDSLPGIYRKSTRCFSCLEIQRKAFWSYSRISLRKKKKKLLLNCIHWNEADSHLGKTLKHRKVKHYGYEFRYDTNNVNKDCPLDEAIPPECSGSSRIKELQSFISIS